MATHTGIDAQAGQDSPEPLIKRWFTTAGQSPLDAITWVKRDVWVGSKYEHLNVEAPDFWSDNAVAITSKLYLSKAEGNREHSVRDLIERVAAKITVEAIDHGYFGERPSFSDDFVKSTHVLRKTFCESLMLDDPPSIFYDELCYVMANQVAIFNSPVLFNVGRDDRPQQVSACFILGVDDTTTSIMETARREAFIFKGGSGSGTSLSDLRGSMEQLSTGGWASGPVSFMRLLDADAGTFKSGGTTRRAACLRKLDADHPDIRDFITCKVREEERIEKLIAAGVNLSFSDAEGERNLAESTSFQNANNSVGVTDEFMRKAVGDDYDPNWELTARKTGETVAIDYAPKLLDLIAQSARACACPGMMWMDAINRMHTTPVLDGEASPITSSNPCFPGETLVDTSEGRIRIDHLAEMYAAGIPLPFAFGFDRDESLPALKRIRQAWMSKIVTELVEVETDKGVVFRCTPDHKILTRDHGRASTGEYVEAQDLQFGQRLRKIGRWVNEQRSDRRYLNHRTTETAPNGTTIQARFMWGQAYGPIPEGMEIHHLNDDPTDDRLSNFELRDEHSHQSFHSSGAGNGRYIDAEASALVEVWEQLEQIYGVGPTEVTVSRWNRYIRAQGLMGVVPLAKYGSRCIRGLGWHEFAAWIDEHRSLVNDTVKSVTRIVLDEPVAVYDISVEDTHNFAVATDGVEHTIVVSNCGEYLSNDDTSCNLGSLNVLKFVRDDGSFEVESFRHVVDVMAASMDVLISFADFPDEIIADRSRKLRQIGLGYSNMGAAIMAQGLAYDSDAGRDFAASVTALETGRVYHKSAVFARELGSFHYFDENRDAMLGVIRKHLGAIPDDLRDDGSIWDAADLEWRQAYSLGIDHGFRNAQATVIPPAGTTSYFLDCDTTGIEPAFLLTIHKEMAGGGTMTIVNQSVERGLVALGYSEKMVRDLVAHVRLYGCLPLDELQFKREHQDVFYGANDISAEGHIKMMAAVQPFVSGAISKTINMPNSATWQDVRDAYALAWRLGCKDLAIYRDGSKARQPHSVKKSEPETLTITGEQVGATTTIAHDGTVEGDPAVAAILKPYTDLARERAVPERHLLPRTRRSITHKIHLRGTMGDYKGYVHAGMYDDGRLAEIFIDGFGRAGSFTLNALARWGTAFSKAIQYGIPWEDFARDSLGVADETGGMVVPEPGQSGAPPIRSAKSVFDYIVRWFALEFGDDDLRTEFGVRVVERREEHVPDVLSTIASMATAHGDDTVELGASTDRPTNGHILGPICGECGSHMRRTGGCFTCTCGNTTGCG